MPKFIYHDTQWSSNQNDSNTFFTGISGEAMTTTIQESNQFFLWTHDDKELMRLTAGANLAVQNALTTKLLSLSNVQTDIIPLSANAHSLGDQSRPFKDIHISGSIFASNALSPFALKETRILAGTGLQGGGTLSNDTTISLDAYGTSGSFGGSNNIPVITTDTHGRVSNVSLSPVSGSLIDTRVLSSGTNYTPTQNTKQVVLHIIGGGGGGGGCCSNDYSAGGGGGAGGFCMAHIKNVGSGPYSYSIGDGGAGGTSNLATGNGGTGGSTSITINGITYSSGGGIGGTFAASSGIFAEGGGGSTSNGLVPSVGDNGFCGMGFPTMTISGRGGKTHYGTGGASVYVTSNGNSGEGYGSGGSGGANINTEQGRNGGSGAPGVILVFEHS